MSASGPSGPLVYYIEGSSDYVWFQALQRSATIRVKQHIENHNPKFVFKSEYVPIPHSI